MRSNLTTYILCGLFIVVSAYVQAGSYLNTDSAWLVDSARKLLSGKDLYTDYIETNPPFIVYLTAIPLAIGISYKLFIFIMAGTSLALSYKYVRSDFLKIILTYGLFLMPAQSFGQREHLLLIFILPYFLSIYVEAKPRIWDVLFALIGFLLKPYFVIIFAGWALWKWRVQKAPLFSTENYIVGTGVVAYVLAIYFFERDYIENVLPLLVDYYNDFYYARTAWHIKCLIGILGVMALLGFSKNSLLFNRRICFAIFTAFLCGLTFIMQDKGWTNHYLPLYFYLLVSIALLMERSQKHLQILLGLIFAGIVTHGTVVNITLICPANQEDDKQIISYMDKYANGREVLPIGYDLGVIYPELIYSKARFNWEYPQLWMLTGLYNKSDVKDEKVIHHTPKQQNPDEVKLFESMVNYVVTQKPAMIIIADKKVQNEKMGKFRFDFIKYFSQDARFASAFKDYRRVAQLSGRVIYVLDQQKPATNMKR